MSGAGILTVREAGGTEVVISDFPRRAMSVQEIEQAWPVFVDAVRDRQVVRFDLKGVSDSNHGVLAFHASAEEHCRRLGIRLQSDNMSPELALAIREGEERDKPTGAERKERSFENIGEFVLDFVKDVKSVIGFIGDVGMGLFYYVCRPHKIPYRDILICIERTGADAAFISGMLCFLSGLILGFQALMQLRRFGLEIYMADMVTLALIKELGPLMVAMICTGRAGSAFAAEIGTMKVNEELDALTTMGMKPVRLLAFPKIVGLAIAVPCLTVLGDILGAIGGMVVALAATTIGPAEYLNRTMSAVTGDAVIESLFKSFVYALIIAAVGCLRGFEAKNNAEGVGGAATSSVVTAIFLVVIADAVITYALPAVLGIFG